MRHKFALHSFWHTLYVEYIAYKYSGINVCLLNNYISLLSSYILSCSPLFLCNPSPPPSWYQTFLSQFSFSHLQVVEAFTTSISFRCSYICLRKVICMKDEKASLWANTVYARSKVNRIISYPHCNSRVRTVNSLYRRFSRIKIEERKKKLNSLRARKTAEKRRNTAGRE